jgi:predicted enzyme related to lactoylglutathione lyase
VEGVAAAFEKRGAMRLGPTRPGRHGGEVAVLRDPGGALVAVGTPPANAEHAVDVGWYVLNTNDAPRAIANYGELFGFAIEGAAKVGPHGAFHPFAWSAGGERVGAIADVATRPGVHPHWLFFLDVDALEPAVEAARAAGGLALDPIVLPSGDRACVCDDPQGAAFGVRERRR